MNEPLFLSYEAVEELHRTSLEEFGGGEGVRDRGLVESALASAVNVWLYGQGDLFEIAAAYAFHISENQAFIDGNKRTALKAAMVFLEVNGVDAAFDNTLVYDLIMEVANGRMDRAGLAEALRELGSGSAIQ